MKRGVFIVAAKRTPFGAFGGKLKAKTPTDLQEYAARAALEAGKISPEMIDSTVIGNIMCVNKDTPMAARHVALRIGVPMDRTAYMVNRLCGSGFQSVVNGMQEIEIGMSNIVLTGGTENMSMAPFVAKDIRFGTKLGVDPVLEDSLWNSLTDHHVKLPMGVTAENLATKYGLTKEDTDAFALRSQTNYAKAFEAGVFNAEMAPIKLKGRKGEEIMSADEHPRATTLESLAKLPAVFKKNGTTTAGNSSGICDGAGAVILASEEAVKKHKLTPLARLTAFSITGCDPTIMGIGPVSAIQNLMKVSNKSLNDMDLIEINEAFAAQTLACQKELGIDDAKLNLNGGAVALGHPVGASGSRITAHLAHELKRTNKKLAIGSACIGGGQGIAVILERV